MNEVTNQDQDIVEALRRNLPSEEPSEGLQRNLRLMARKAVTPKVRWWRTALPVACTLAAGAAVVALTLVPSQASAKSFAKLMSAVEQISSFQMTIDSTENGKHEVFSIAGVDGKFAMRADDGVILQFDADSLRFYDPEENVVTRFHLGGLVDAKMIAEKMQAGMEEGFKRSDLKQMLKEFEQKYGKEHIKISPIRSEDGHDVYDVHLEAPNEPERVDMMVNAATDLPERMLVEEKNSAGQWQHEATMEMRFGQRVDPKLLTPTFPANAKKVDVDINDLVSGAMKGIESIGSAMGQFDPGLKARAKMLGKDFKAKK
jgi:hypothetical protein